jgi:hypothetical protein
MSAHMENVRAHQCTCSCHTVRTVSTVVVCCDCRKPGRDDCGCEEPRGCCGDPRKPNRPDSPQPPGWQPGDRPPKDPLDGITDEGEIIDTVRTAIIDIIRTGSGPGGPKMGPRKNEYLPYLLIRANAGDRGNRPLNVPFWESPDITVMPGSAAAAPESPPAPGAVAQAGVPNTLWAHVWNLGWAPVYNARVEFYWFNPTLGFNEAAANLIGVTHVDLGNRTSGHAHRYVKCPTSWTPTYLNGGHECLMARIFEPLTDPLTPDPWNAAGDRHVGQRNISVIDSHSPASVQLNVRLGCGTPPGRAELTVQEVNPRDVAWLSIMEGKRDHGYTHATGGSAVAGMMHPTLVRRDDDKAHLEGIDLGSAERLLQRKMEITRGCDELEALFYMHVDGLHHQECRVFRIMQTAGGRLVGGYTVIARRQ